MKILNLFAGIGGNRSLWGDKHQITAVEYDQKVAGIYLKRFPNDIVIVGDAYDYFINNFERFDFIWLSPPCQSHSKYTNFRVGYAYKGKRRKLELPDLRLYSLILFCKHQIRADWIIENVIGYYKPLIIPTAIRGRHYYWSNKYIPDDNSQEGSIGLMGTFCSNEILKNIANDRNIDLELLKDLNKYTQNQMLRNMIMPKEGKKILEYIIKKQQKNVLDYLK